MCWSVLLKQVIMWTASILRSVKSNEGEKICIQKIFNFVTQRLILIFHEDIREVIKMSTNYPRICDLHFNLISQHISANKNVRRGLLSRLEFDIEGGIRWLVRSAHVKCNVNLFKIIDSSLIAKIAWGHFVLMHISIALVNVWGFAFYSEPNKSLHCILDTP